MDLRVLLDVVLRDFVGTPVADVPTRLVFRAADPGFGGDGPDVLVHVEDNYTTLGAGLGEQEILVEVASYLQDYVMDQWNRTWPATDHDAPRVLEPFLGADGIAVWGDRRRAVAYCAVGDLCRHRDR